MLGRAWTWLCDRFGFQPIRENFLFRRVPKGPWYSGDGEAMLVLMVTQLVTGGFLALSYVPSIGDAYQSVLHITRQQTLGGFVRALHYWSAGVWIVVLMFHLFRQILTGGYKAPREGSWLVGVLLFFVVWALSFIGYVLRWDERAIYGLRVALNHFYQIPWIGDDLVVLVLGGPEITTLTLARLYAVHAILGPGLLVALSAYHLYLVVVRGTTAPTEKERPIEDAREQKEVYHQDAHSEEKGETFYPATMARLMPMWLMSFVAVVVLAAWQGPQALCPEANLTRDSFPMEEWWWAWYSALAALLPSWLAPSFYAFFPILLFLALVALPFVDRGPYRGMQHRPVAIAVVALCVIAMIYLSSLRSRSPWTAWPTPEPPPVPAGIELTERPERGRQLFAVYGCNSCHAVSGHGPQVGTDMARLDERYSLDALRRYVLHPPEGVAMPSYAGRITSEDLELVVEFCHAAQTFPRGRTTNP